MSNQQPVRMTTTVRMVLGVLLDGHTEDLWGMACQASAREGIRWMK